MELLIARNPDPDSALPFLLRLPLGDGLLFRTKGTWPRTGALYCHPVPMTDWPEPAEIVERVPLRACTRRGAAIDVVADRSRESRSQVVFTQARGRDVVFWQSPRTRKQARPDVRVPTARAAGIPELEIVVDAHERYAYRFSGQQVRTVRRALSCGDYAVTVDDEVIAAVERKSPPSERRLERRVPALTARCCLRPPAGIVPWARGNPADSRSAGPPRHRARVSPRALRPRAPSRPPW